MERTSIARHITLWNTQEWQLEPTQVSMHASYPIVASEMFSIVGMWGSSLIFLDHLHWFCTLDTGNPCDGSYIRHFFIPPEWRSSGLQPFCAVTAKGDVVVVKDGGIIIAKDGLSLENVVTLDTR
jgi:hypothetical protein